MLRPNIQQKNSIKSNIYNYGRNKSLALSLFCCLLLSSKIVAQDTTSIRKQQPKDSVHHHHYKITQVYCKLKTTHGHLQNEKFYVYCKDKIIHEFSIPDFITEYYFPIDIENWHIDDELFLGIENIKGHLYHFKRRKREDGVYEYDLIIDIEKIKKRHH